MAEIRTQLDQMGDLWARKEELVAGEYRAAEFWAGLSDDRRQAIMVIVMETFVRLVEDPASWLPLACDDGGDRIDVTISIALREIEAAELASRVEEKRSRQTAMAQLKELEKGLR